MLFAASCVLPTRRILKLHEVRRTSQLDLFDFAVSPDSRKDAQTRSPSSVYAICAIKPDFQIAWSPDSNLLRK
jgi:hypothetical protein